MNDDKTSKAEKRAWDIAASDQKEWERVTEPHEFSAEVIKLQRQYGLPIEFQSMMIWLGWDEPVDFDQKTGELIFGQRSQRRNRLFQEIKELAERFEIPMKFFESLKRLVLWNAKGPAYQSLGFPAGRVRQKDGQIIHELIITPTTDLGNPLDMEFIKNWQYRNQSIPPQPQPMRDNTRKLDWRPVWEWNKRHPKVTRKEIAEMLNRNPVNVRSKLEELDKGN